MAIHKTADFGFQLKKLPAEIRKLFEKQEVIFKDNWLDPRLHVKRIKEMPGAYSFRITRRYRAIFYFRNGDVIFFSIGHRKDIYE